MVNIIRFAKLPQYYPQVEACRPSWGCQNAGDSLIAFANAVWRVSAGPNVDFFGCYSVLQRPGWELFLGSCAAYANFIGLSARRHCGSKCPLLRLKLLF
jgi:hypothetical protein